MRFSFSLHILIFVFLNYIYSCTVYDKFISPNAHHIVDSKDPMHTMHGSVKNWSSNSQWSTVKESTFPLLVYHSDHFVIWLKSLPNHKKIHEFYFCSNLVLIFFTTHDFHHDHTNIDIKLRNIGLLLQRTIYKSLHVPVEQPSQATCIQFAFNYSKCVHLSVQRLSFNLIQSWDRLAGVERCDRKNCLYIRLMSIGLVLVWIWIT